MQAIQKQYNEYSFIDPAVSAEDRMTKESEDISKWINQMKLRTYEASWYFVVFSPMNRPYDADPQWFNHKGLSKCREKIGKCYSFLMTKETEATKVHINALCCSESDLSLLNGKKCYNKYSVYARKLDGPLDRLRVAYYISKEERSRTFDRYVDYICSL